MRTLCLCLLLLLNFDFAVSSTSTRAMVKAEVLSDTPKATSQLSKKELRRQLRKEMKAYRRKPKSDRAAGVLVSLILWALFALFLKWASHLLGGMMTYGQAVLWILGIAGFIALVLLIFIIVIFNDGFQMC